MIRFIHDGDYIGSTSRGKGQKAGGITSAPGCDIVPHRQTAHSGANNARPGESDGYRHCLNLRSKLVKGRCEDSPGNAVQDDWRYIRYAIAFRASYRQPCVPEHFAY
ncbi:hypothetical protein, partial [Enterobacter sp. CGMCC 5087]|uniref:hypothetical protein n=1 Tax=Enterobacter sp. CGMCC 5087 TaxID=2183878 RepID=UPI0011B27918